MHSLWYGKFRAKLDDKQGDAVKNLLEGGPQDFSQYKYQVGYLAGLRVALESAEELDNEMIGLGHHATSIAARGD